MNKDLVVAIVRNYCGTVVRHFTNVNTIQCIYLKRQEARYRALWTDCCRQRYTVTSTINSCNRLLE